MAAFLCTPALTPHKSGQSESRTTFQGVVAGLFCRLYRPAGGLPAGKNNLFSCVKREGNSQKKYRLPPLVKIVSFFCLAVLSTEVLRTYPARRFLVFCSLTGSPPCGSSPVSPEQYLCRAVIHFSYLVGHPSLSIGVAFLAFKKPLHTNPNELRISPTRFVRM